MKDLIERAPIVGGILAVAGVASTVFYLLGFGLGVGHPILLHCDISDYVRFSVVWLAPLSIYCIIVGIVAMLRSHYALVLVAAAFALTGVLCLVTYLLRTDRSMVAAAGAAQGLLGAAVLLASHYALRNKSIEERWQILVLTFSLLFLIIAITTGVMEGAEVSRSPESSVTVENRQSPYRGVLIFQLNDAILLQVTGSRHFLYIPRSRIVLIEQPYDSGVILLRYAPEGAVPRTSKI